MSDQALSVNMRVDAAEKLGAYKPLWNWFGYDEPNYTYTEHGKKLLKDLAELSPEPVRVRTHNLLTSGDGTSALKWGSTNAYSEDAQGNPVYDWSIMDEIFDAYVEAGVIPFVQVAFTPEDLSDDPGPYQHSFSLKTPASSITTGWAAPPNDLKKWGDLIEAWARHMGERYGVETVTSWPWEIWNEPDGLYWTGTIPQFCAMFDVAAAAIRRALPGVRVGGPHTCGPHDSENASEFLRQFLAHCATGKNAATGETGSQLDIVGFHAKGKPEVHDGKVRMGISRHLANINSGVEIVCEFDEHKDLPIILGESDPEGCAACSARVYPQNAYRNGPLYGAYIVEMTMRTYEIARRHNRDIEGAVTWAFMFEDQPWFDGFRDLATNGVNKAVLNGFRLMGKLSGSWVKSSSDTRIELDDAIANGIRNQPDIDVVATRDEKGLSILCWHYHDDDVAGADASIKLAVDHISRPKTVRHYRMDANHSNAFATWQELGSPQQPNETELAALHAASELAEIDAPLIEESERGITASFNLPRQGVSLIRIEL